MAIKRLPSTGDAPRSTGVPASLVPGGAADSAGFPWQGRTFDHHETAFAGDDGAAPAHLALAVSQLREAASSFVGAPPGTQRSALDALALAHAGIVEALTTSRLLVPLLAEAGELGETPEGRTVEKTQELSIVTVTAPDGRTVMPVFSSAAAMRHWNPEARPIPVPATQLALAAAQESTDLIVIDAGSPDLECGVRRPALRALALGEPAVPAWADPAVRAAFAEALGGDARIEAVALLPGDPGCRLRDPEVEVHLMLAAGLDREALSALLTEVQQRVATSQVIADGVDSMKLVPHAAPYSVSTIR